MIDWTEDKVRFILDAARGGLSRGKIAKAFAGRFGETVSKSAVIGKLNRFPGYVREPTPIGKTKQDKPATPAKPRCVGAGPGTTCVATRLPVAQPERVNSRRPGYRSDDTGCLWPVGTPGTPGFHSCDKPLRKLNEPYCAQHWRDSRVPDPKRESPAAAAGARLPEGGD